MPTVQSLPLVSDADFSKFNLTSGHITVFNSSYFYILTRSSLTEINTKKPLLAWFNGGPGCSSLDGFFLENGPLRFTPTSINLNDGYWDDFDMLFIDNPPGTGYSTGEFYTSSTQILDGFKEFYRKFSDLYKYDDLYLGGESFAGVWIPFMAQQVTVKGIILGNPWIDPVEQYPSVVEYAKLHGLLTGGYLSRAQEDTQKCLEKISADSSVKTNYDICERITNHVLEESKTTGFCINKYDYTLRDTGPHQQCGMAWPVGIQEMKTYLGRGDVKVAFHSEYKPKIWYVILLLLILDCLE